MGKWVVLDCGRLVTSRNTFREIIELDNITNEVIKEKNYYITKMQNDYY